MENLTNETPVVEETVVVEETPVVEETVVETVEATVEPSVEAPAEKNKLWGILSLVCGIVSILVACCGASIPFGVAAIVFNVIDKKKNEASSTLSKIGMICGIIGLVIGGVVLVLSLIGNVASSTLSSSYY